MRAVMMLVVVGAAVMLPALTVVVQGQIPGGLNDISLEPEHPVVVFAVEQIRNRMNLGSDIALVSVEEAKSQVTDRVTYFLKLSMSGGYACKIQIVDYWAAQGFSVKGQPRCYRPLSTRQILGGVSKPEPLPEHEGPRTSSVLDALDAAVCAVGHHALGNKAFRISDTSGVTYTSQVTSGMTYRYYNVPLTETTCRQNVCHRDDLGSCDTQRQPKKKRCDFEVQHTPGPNPEFVVSPDRIQACVDLN